jgi:hypothetical protein
LAILILQFVYPLLQLRDFLGGIAGGRRSASHRSKQ